MSAVAASAAAPLVLADSLIGVSKLSGRGGTLLMLLSALHRSDFDAATLAALPLCKGQ